MFEAIGEAITGLLGLETPQANLWQIGLRAVVIYISALMMIRLGGDRRFIGKHAAMDALLGVILGSTLSRAINGGAPFFATLLAAFALVGMHWLFSAIAFYWERFDTLIKGRSYVLIRDGQMHRRKMEKSHISQRDLESLLRLKAKLTDINQVQVARLETSGDVSIIPKEKPPRVIEINVESGVQTVRIELD